MRTSLTALALGLAALAANAGGPHEPWTETGIYVSASDGDSVKVRTVGRGVVSVRIAGIDTPERGQGHWRVARSHLVAFVKSPGLTIHCYKTDQYDREVCRVRTDRGDLGASLVAAGLAWHFRGFEDEQTAEERALYAQLEQRAREQRIGLWQEPDPMPPDECRKVRRSGAKNRCR